MNWGIGGRNLRPPINYCYAHTKKNPLDILRLT